MHSKSYLAEIERAAGHRVSELSPLSGGCVGQVYQVVLANGETLVAKVDTRPNPRLDIEAYMLQYLKENSALPVPEVIASKADLLLMSILMGSSQFGRRTEEHAAELLAHLHLVKGPSFGLERNTLIAGLDQPNPWSDSWLTFFRDQRLLYMGHECVRAGRFSGQFYGRLERLAERMDEWLDEPQYPSLIHGDVWSGNILAADGRVTGFIDPAIYYADAEIELAFSTLFSTFGRWFFDHYRTLRPIAPGFFEVRRDIYNLYPLLVHTRLFGGSYLNSVERTLSRFGC